MPDSDLLDWIALNLLDGWGPLMRARALERFGSPGDAAYRANPGELRRIAPRGASGFGRARLALATASSMSSIFSFCSPSSNSRLKRRS